MAPLCAELSIPSASPLTTITSCFARNFAIIYAALSPLGEAFREPMTETLGDGNGIGSCPVT